MATRVAPEVVNSNGLKAFAIAPLGRLLVAAYICVPTFRWRFHVAPRLENDLLRCRKAARGERQEVAGSGSW